MKIGLVSPYDYSYPGGVNTHVSYLAHYFLLEGHDVKIIAPCSKNGTLDSTENAIAIGRAFPIPSNKSMARIPLSPWLPIQVKKVLRDANFDILHIHEPFVPLLSLTSLLESNSINVGTFHAYLSKARAYRLWRPLLKKWLPKLQGKIAVSNAARDSVSRYLPGNYQVIPNGIDVDLFSPQVSPLKEFTDGKVNILFVGRLEKRKGLDYLLTAYSKVKQQFPHVRLIVVGGGTKLRPKYERMVEESNLADVVFAGFVPGNKLPQFYSSADIFCSPAISGESFGIVLLEAMASSKPIIASDIGGFNEVLSHGVEGLLVPPKDEKALTQALLSLIKDRSLRQQMGAKGRIKAEKYSWANVAHRIMDYYVTLLNEPGEVVKSNSHRVPQR